MGKKKRKHQKIKDMVQMVDSHGGMPAFKFLTGRWAKRVTPAKKRGTRIFGAGVVLFRVISVSRRGRHSEYLYLLLSFNPSIGVRLPTIYSSDTCEKA